MTSDYSPTVIYYVTKKKWRYPGVPIPERLKDKYAVDPKPERRVRYGWK